MSKRLSRKDERRRKKLEQAQVRVSRENYPAEVAERERLGFLSATPERVAKLEDEVATTATIDDQGHRVVFQRVTTSPLERLFRTGALGPDKKQAEARVEVGRALFSYWYFGELYPLASRDYRKPYTGSSDRFALLPAAERREHCRRKWREADAMFRSHGPGGLGYDRIGLVTSYVVIDEKPLAEAGLIVTGRRDNRSATAVAHEMLIDGLDRLVALWR